MTDNIWGPPILHNGGACPVPGDEYINAFYPSGAYGGTAEKFFDWSIVTSYRRLLANATEAAPTGAMGDDGYPCQRCGYHITVDAVVEHDLWNKIRPEGKPESAGLLCANCMVEALSASEGWSAVRLVSSDDYPLTRASDRAAMQEENGRLTGLMSERSQMLGRYNLMLQEAGVREEAWKAKLAERNAAMQAAVEALTEIEGSASPDHWSPQYQHCVDVARAALDALKGVRHE